MSSKSKGWIYVTVQIVLIAAVILFSMRDFLGIIPYNFAIKITGLIIFISGILLMAIQLFTFSRFGQIMTPNPVPPDGYSLIQSGFYKYVRHPMYSAALFTLLGIVIYYHSIAGFLVWMITVLFIIWKIRFEEINLIQKFPEYKVYQSKTRKLIPSIY